MTEHVTTHTTLDDWIAREAIPFSLDDDASFNAAVDRMLAMMGDGVELLGLGEALHGGEEILILRNRLFQRLVEAHGYSAIAIESSFPRARVVNEYVAGRGPASYEEIQDAGFSYGFRGIEATRELVEWMRAYNADPSHRIKLQFYGFDSPTEMSRTDSPRQVLYFVLDYLASVDSPGISARRERIDALLGQDAAWENPMAMMDPSQAIGLSPAATALRIETEDLTSELQVRRPDWIARSDTDRYSEVVHYAEVARQLLNYHAVLATASTDRTVRLLGIRDAVMANNLEYILSRERARGKVLVFAHNSHLQRSKPQWQLGPDLLTWWSVGGHLNEIFGPRYVVIGSGVGVSDENGIGQPEAGSLEARLTAAPGPARFVPTHRGQGLPTASSVALPVRSGSTRNSMYFPLTPSSLSDFDGLVVLDSITYTRGGVPLPG